MTTGITFDDPAMPVAIAVAVPDDARLHKGAVACHRDGAHVVVAQMEMPLHNAQPLISCTKRQDAYFLDARCENMLAPLVTTSAAHTSDPPSLSQ